MIKKILLFLLFLIIPSFSFSDDILINRLVKTYSAPAGEPCNSAIYTWGSGDNESFEASAGQFCTAGWTIVNGGGNITSSYDSNWFNCGTHALSIVLDNDASAGDGAYADIGSAVGTGYIRFYIIIPDLDDFDQAVLSKASSSTSSGSTDYNLATAIRDNTTGGTDARIHFYQGGTLSTDYFPVTEGQKYRVEHYFANTATITMRVYDSAGSTVNTFTGGVQDLTDTGRAFDTRYIHFYNSYTFATTPVTMYIDDVKYASADWVGAQTCQ